MNRGDRRGAIFLGDQDRGKFVADPGPKKNSRAAAGTEGNSSGARKQIRPRF